MTLPGTDQVGDVVDGCASARRWEALVAYRESVVRLARRRGAGSEAEDVAQEALLRAASNPELDLTRAHSYLAKVAVNLVVDLHRRAAKERALRGHAGLAPRPCLSDEDVEERDLARRAMRLFSGLAPELRTILLLRGDGATWPQVGAALGESPAAIEIRYRRAMVPLRRQLGVGRGGVHRSVEPAPVTA